MSMLDNPSIRYITICLINHSTTLQICAIISHMFKSQTSIWQLSQNIFVQLVQTAGIHHIAAMREPIVSIGIEICFSHYLDTIEHASDHGCVTIFRNSLPPIVEITVVERKAQRQARDNRRGQFCGFSSPLLFGIPFYQDFIHRSADKRHGLFFKIAWRRIVLQKQFIADTPHGISRSCDTIYLIKCMHIERKVIKSSSVMSQRHVAE